MPKSMYNHHDFRDQDFYCSFTHLPQSDINPDELSYTIHGPKSISRLRPSTMQQPHQAHRRMPSAVRPDSFDSTTSSSTYSSFLSATSSFRRRKLMAKIRQLFRKHQKQSMVFMRSATRKPSTLDFRCIGTNEKSHQSCLDITNIFSIPVYDAPKVQWHEPVFTESWGEGWW